MTTDALAPVREALLAAAEHEVRQLRTSMEEAARRTVDEATARAERLRAQARIRGAADATAAMAAQRARAGQRARAVVLRAQREEYDALHAAAQAALPRLRDEMDYPRLRPAMIDAVRTLLDADAQLRDADGGGIVGEAAGRRVDCSLHRFLTRAVDAVVAQSGSTPGHISGEARERR